MPGYVYSFVIKTGDQVCPYVNGTVNAMVGAATIIPYMPVAPYLSLPVTAGHKYRVKVNGIWQGHDVNSCLKVGLMFGASPGVAGYCAVDSTIVRCNSNVVGQIQEYRDSLRLSSGTMTYWPSPSCGLPDTDYPFFLEGMVFPATTANLTLMVGPSGTGTPQITLRAGTLLELYDFGV